MATTHLNTLVLNCGIIYQEVLKLMTLTVLNALLSQMILYVFVDFALYVIFLTCNRLIFHFT